MREEEENRLVPERGGAIPQGRQNRARITAVLRISGERFWQPGGTIGRGKRGKGRGDCGLLIGTAQGRNGRGINRIEEGSNSLRGNVSGEKSGSRRKKLTWPNWWGPRVSERGRGFVPVREIKEDGPRAATGAGPKGSPGVLLYFYLFASFSFSGFPISFVSFANMIQIKPNQFRKFCKIDSKVLNQQQTCFQDQNKIFNKGS
jgi:hypothetical protein